MFQTLFQIILRYWRYLFVSALAVGVFVQIVALLPRGLEEDLPTGELEKSTLAKAATLKPRKPGFEADIPEYTIHGFQYVSVQRGVKQWKIIADDAFFYEKKGMVTVREVHAEIYDEKGKITIVEAREGEYELVSRNLSLYKEVVSHFPDGFITESEVLHYYTLTKWMNVPPPEPVKGYSLPEFGKDKLTFTSVGAEYYANKGVLVLFSDVKVKIESPQKEGKMEVTNITSDRAHIERETNKATFSMSPTLNVPKLVLIQQPDMKCTSKRAYFYFKSATKSVEVLQAVEDVTIIESPKKPNPNDLKEKRNENPAPRISTGGMAEFYADKNTILLKQYPQVVQDHDTVTGELITIYRNTDQVEVERSNAYSERKQNP